MTLLSIDSFFRNETKHKTKKSKQKEMLFFSQKEFKNMFTFNDQLH